MSFGGPSFDAHPDEIGFPTHSMVTGLLGNALGLTRRDGDVLNRIQACTSIAIGCLREGERIVDFQTVDIAAPHMRGPMWTGSARAFAREGSDDALIRQVRRRPIVADAHFVCTVSLIGDCGYTLDAFLEALHEPARPLFIGRNSNVPTRPIGHSIVESEDVLSAFATAGFTVREAKLPVRSPSASIRATSVPGLKDFVTGLHSGTETYEERKVQ